MKSKEMDMLIGLLTTTQDRTTKAIILQTYIQQFGAIPNEYSKEIRALMEKENE